MRARGWEVLWALGLWAIAGVLFSAGCSYSPPRPAGASLPAVQSERDYGPVREWWPAFSGGVDVDGWERLALWSSAAGVLMLVLRHWSAAGMLFAGSILLPTVGRLADALAGLTVYFVLVGAAGGIWLAWYILRARGIVRESDDREAPF